MYKHGYPELCFLVIVGVLAATTASLVTFECPAGWDIIGTHCYHFVNINMDFEDARDVCYKSGAHLLVVRDEVEASNVSSVASQRFTNGEHFWVYNGRYEQDTGQGSLNSTFCRGMWQPNEPRETNENVAVASNMQGRWALTWVWSNLPFVCRKPACPVGSFQCSDGSCINMKWKCDGAYDCKDMSDENDCSDEVKYFTSSSGSVDTSNLASTDFFQWIIEGQPGEVLTIEFETLTIEDHVDSVSVYSGGPTILTSDLIQDIRTSLPGRLSLFSRNHFVIVTLQSFIRNNQPVVKFNWKSDSEASWKQVNIVNVTSSESSISSPYYSSLLTPVSFKREWLLRVSEGELITLEILYNNLELNASTDFYIVTDVGFVLKELNSHKAIYISNKNSMSVIIKSRSSKKNFNFSAIVRKGCDFVTNLTLATFAVKNLPANTSCSWKVQNEVATNFSLQINEKAIADSSDAIQIYSGFDKNSSAIIGTLNHSTIGQTEYESIPGVVSFIYLSDSAAPSIEFNGKLSADCSDLQSLYVNVIYNKTKTAAGTYKAQLSCPKGFRFKQEEYSNNATLSAVCNEGGRWDWGLPSYTRTPECQIVYCGFPPTIPNGFVSSIYGNVTYNSVASYQCFSGFGIVGYSNVTCQADGSWSRPRSCRADNCSKIQDVPHGNSSDSSDVSEGSVVTFSCDPGYSLQGARTIACLSNKTWSHPQPNCKELTCPLPVIKHGHYKHTSIPKFGESVSLLCDPGYKINRTQTQNDTSITCGFNRTLSVENDICVDVDECNITTGRYCSATTNCVNVAGSYQCLCKNGYNGTNCDDVDECSLGVCHQKCKNLVGSYSCSCDQGYVLYTKNGTNGFYIPAGEDGLKPSDVFQINHTCVPVTCNNGTVPSANGTVLVTRSTYYYNETLNVLCDFGFTLEKPSVAVCSSNGNWTYSNIPKCQKTTCMQPPVGKHETSRVPAKVNIEPGASLTITCKLDNGTVHITNKTLFCAPSPDGSGQFSLQGDDPACPEVDCGKPLPIPGGIINVKNTTYGSSFEFSCDSNRGSTIRGASTLGNTTVVCRSNGRWGFGNLTCEGPSCKDPGTKAGTVQIVKTSYKIDQIVQYNCTLPGFETVTNDTLTCVYKNGTAVWSGVPPACKDTQAPNMTCPTVKPLDLYSPLEYPQPTVVDNSGFACLMIKSGPPSGVSVVTKNVTVTYTASDSWNHAVCNFRVTVKDRTEPKINCLPGFQIDLASQRSKLLNLSEVYSVTHSGDGIVEFNPSGPLNLTLESVIPVHVNITKENGLVKGCAFLITAKSSVCINDSLPSLENGRIEKCSGNGNNMTCVGVCDDGYLFQTTSNSTDYSCLNGVWTMNSTEESCIKLSYPNYNYSVSLNYLMSGPKLPPSPEYDAYTCLTRHYNLLSELVQKILACGYQHFTAHDFTRHEVGLSSEKIAFTLQLLAIDRNETNLKNCAEILKNQSVTLFGPTYPVTGSRSCFSPWTVIPNTSVILPQNISCSISSKMVDYNGTKYCLPCGPGTFFNTTTEACQQCQDGYYQDKEGQSTCKICSNGVLRSHVPRSKKSHCFELCPEGFTSTSGYLEDTCTACPENLFSISSNSCQPCPNNGSTLGISGASSVDQCSDLCLPGEYSITGYKPCSACPRNFFSHSQAAKMCSECPSDTVTAGYGSTSISDCANGSSLCTDDFCYPNGTENNSMCEIIDHRPVCSCKPGFYGDSCNNSCNVCDPNPCYNGGSCTASGLSFTCSCKNEISCTFTRNKNIMYTSDVGIGTVDAVGSDECRERCLNNYQCVAYLVEDGSWCYLYSTLNLDYSEENMHESYQKDCSEKPLFDGPLCEKDLINDCNASICASIEFCVDLVGDTACQCPHDGGHYDSRCARLNDVCAGKNCSLHGKCISHGSVRAVCECDPGYTGDRCETDINECDLNQHGCLYNGKCQDGVNTYSCSCAKGFGGDHCEMLEDICSNSNCNPGGLCANDFQNFTASCTCGEHYMPDSNNPGACVPINYCLSNPCVNGACTNVTGGFSCHCNPGFEGSHCQHDIDDCVKDVCKNGATCFDRINSFSCECPVGFTGRYCEDDIDDCPGKCVFSNTESKCQDLVDDYYCPCKPAYTGKNCSQPVNMCSVYEPCLNGGNCSNFTGGYNCTCAAGWTGVNCEQEIDYCTPNPCQNSGTCLSLVDRYFCKCPDGAAGKHCEETEKLCDAFNDTVCSIYGKCEVSERTIGCQCPEEYSGKACELEKDHCAGDPCNGGICTQNHLTYVCDCSNVRNYGGKHCNETKHPCSECPKSTTCLEFEDQDGYIRLACLCRANEILVGDTCKTLDKDYDLAFLESFANKDKFVTSESGFYLDKNTSLTVSMWVAAAKPLDDNKFLLALRSSNMSSPFLSVFNTRVEFSTNDYQPVDLTEDIGLEHSMDESFTWHFLSVVWSANGSLEITFDFVTITELTILALPPSDVFVFIDIGQSFYGYISQVSVWNTALTSEEHFDMFKDKLAIPQPNSLVLGWTQYSFDSSVKLRRGSTAARSVSICDIQDTIAKMGLDSPECENVKFTDKTPPDVFDCRESMEVNADYSHNQFNSSDLGYVFEDEAEGKTLFPESQLFSFGAHDIAFSSTDSTGNIGICMTRAYVTPNQCSDTKPTQSLVTKCLDNTDGNKVTCPAGMLPSVPTPNFVSCGKLLTYNLDNLYEQPDRIVCGDKKPISVSVNILLHYTLIVSCDDRVITEARERLESIINSLNKKWTGLCSDTNCSNVIVNGTCSDLSLDALIQIIGLNASQSSPTFPKKTVLEFLKNSVADKTVFDISEVAIAHLEDKSKVDQAPSCGRGYSLSGTDCVHCGPGSYYDAGEMRCQLCQLNTYSQYPTSTFCTPCSPDKVTLQRGSSSPADCKKKCQPGHMLNLHTDTCEPCPDNFYQDQEGKSYCFPCPPATGTSHNGTISQADCIAN